MGGVPPWGGGRVGHGRLRTVPSAGPPRAWARRHRIWCRPVPRRPRIATCVDLIVILNIDRPRAWARRHGCHRI